MNRRIPATVLAAVALAALLSPSAMTAATTRTEVFPIEDVRPGMHAVGRTVFSGDRIEEFDVHVIGVLKNVVGPNRTLVLARLAGGPLATTGVIAGMSGSPVYIGGRLLGAVSYQLGQFPKEPIAGITPIAEMTDATLLGAPTPPRPISLPWPPSPDDLFAMWQRDLGRAATVPLSGAQALAANLFGVATTTLQPIGVPLVSAGFADGVLSPVSAALMARGFVPVASATTAVSPALLFARRTLQPGDAMGVALLTGDFALGATGTVTHIDGDRVYGFGHPMYNLGPTEFPLTHAEVHVVLPSLLTSSKLASLGQTIGTIQQDRATAVAGRLGSGPSLIPIRLTLTSDRAPVRTFSFAMVRDHTFTPLLAYLSVANVLTSYERGAGPASFRLSGTARLRGHESIALGDMFSGEQAAGAAAAHVSAPLSVLLKNAANPVHVEELSLSVDASERPRSMRIARAWLDTARVRAGHSVPLRVLLQAHDGTEVVKGIDVTIPANATGTWQLLIADAQRLALDDRRAPRPAETLPAEQLVRTLNETRRSNRLYVRLSSPDEGALLLGEPLTGLPPSVLAVLESDRQGSGSTTLRYAPRGEWSLPLDATVTGSRQLTLAVERP